MCSTLRRRAFLALFRRQPESAQGSLREAFPLGSRSPLAPPISPPDLLTCAFTKDPSQSNLKDVVPALPAFSTLYRQELLPHALDGHLILRYPSSVHIITRRRLTEFARTHPDARAPLNYWFAIVRKTDYASFVDLRITFPSADQVGRFTVFNIGGNKFRLIAAIHYNRQKVYVRHVLTHAEYDRNTWRT